MSIFLLRDIFVARGDTPAVYHAKLGVACRDTYYLIDFGNYFARKVPALASDEGLDR